ncbi:MAG: ATP synthase subunit b [Flavobacteriales bacterium UBA4585]|nr:F0F1 ATP synthase subunit B [Schleiferiaceae bacterium]CAI8156897.1 MAG: ATP synthase subunit b [Flavobacteriales bacterium UBA4585]
MDKLINDFSIGLFFWQSLVFLLLIFVLKRYAWKPILNAVNEREQSIEDALKEAEKARLEMQSLQESNEAILKEAREERERILKEARDMKNKMISEAKDAAATEADKAIVSAKAAIEAEKSAAIAELKNQAASLSIDVAEKILGQELSAENKQTAMIGKIIEDVKFN